MRSLVPLVMAISLALAPAAARACTTFREGGLVGKCYDWSMGQGVLLLNPRGLVKKALPMSPSDRPATWKAVHASVTFNQYGRELPNGGMNDAGLVVEVMWLDETSLPAPDDRPTVNELQWIQSALDRWSTVEELAVHAGNLRVSRVSGRVHYLACDRTRTCAAFEFVNHQLVVTRQEALVVPVLTNDTYAASVSRLREHQGFGGQRPVPVGRGSLDRFVRAASLVARNEPPNGILDSVCSGSQWRILYDPERLTVSWRTLAQPTWKQLEFGVEAAACDQPVRMLDLDAAFSGDAAPKLVPYSEAADLALVKRSFRGMELPSGTAERVARYPESLRCEP